MNHINHLKIIILILSTIGIGFRSNAQKKFEGSIKFKTEISTEGLNKIELKKILDKKYGDSLIISYSKFGYLKRQYLNCPNGNDIQIYDPRKGILYLKEKRSFKFDSLDVKINSIVKLISKKKISNEIIMNFNCECIEYNGISMYNDTVTINYCFSDKTSKTDYKVFKNHEDFFLNDYFETSKRPYLKFSVQTNEFKISQFATEIDEKEIDKKLFEIK